MPYERDDSPYAGDFTQGVDMGFGFPVNPGAAGTPGYPGGTWINVGPPTAPPSGDIGSGPAPPGAAPGVTVPPVEAPAQQSGATGSWGGPPAGSGWGGDGWTDAIFGGITRRRVRELEKQGRALARGVAKGIGDALERIWHGPKPEAPKPPRPPGVPDWDAMGRPPIFMGGRYLWGIVGGVISGSIWEGWPIKPLGSGELPPPLGSGRGTITERDRDILLPPMRVPGQILGPVSPVSVPGGSIYLPGVIKPFPDPNMGPPAPQPRPAPELPEAGDSPEARSRGREALERIVRDRARGAIDELTGVRGVGRIVLPNPAPEPNTVGPPAPQRSAPQPRPGPAPDSTSSTSSSSRSSPRIGLGAVLIGAPLLFFAVRRSGRPPINAPGAITEPTPTVDTPPVTVPVTTPTTLLYGGNYFAGSTGVPYCEPKPRGPRRKCLERAPVKFSGGRRKGKPAGTKCLRWAGRPS